MTSIKILIDTCVLVSASINSLIIDLGIKLEHHHYKYAKPLFDFLRKNTAKRLGVVTLDIEKEARKVLSKAVVSEIEEIHKKDPKINQFYLLKQSSIILSESIRKLENFQEILVREPTQNNKRVPQIFSFYFKLGNELKKHDPVEKANAMIRASPKIKGFKFIKEVRIKQQKESFPCYYKLVKKLIDKTISYSDVRILSQAIHLKEFYKKTEKDKIFIASTDYHFVGIREKDGKISNTFVPDRIYKEFEIICDWPDEIIKKIST